MSTIAFSSGYRPSVASRSVAAPSAARPHLRLTTRGRVVFGALLAIPMLAGALLLGVGGQPAEAGAHAAPDTFSYVVVAPGQSLWGLAEQLAPGADPRDVIAELMSLNGLASGDVVPGQRLAIPAQYAR